MGPIGHWVFKKVSNIWFPLSAQDLSNAMTPPQLEIFFKRMVALRVPKDPWLIHFAG
jgi:hypothetical protein